MGVQIYISDFENRVRSLLGVDETSISNITISYYEYKGLSEKIIKQTIPEWESFYTAKEQAEIEMTSIVPGDGINYTDEQIKQINALQEIINVYKEKINLFEACIVLKTAISLVVAIQYGAIKVQQTTNAKIEYGGINIDTTLKMLKDRLEETISILREQNNNNIGKLSVFTITNPDKRRWQNE